MPVVNLGPQLVARTLFERVDAAVKAPIAENIGRWLAFAGCVGGETWFELQAIGVPTGKSYKESRHAHARSAAEAAVLLEQAEHFNAPGVFVIANQIKPAVTARGPSRQRWLVAEKGVSTTDLDIECRTILFVDVDAERTRGTSATDEEKLHARKVAEAVILRLHDCHVPSRSIGLGDSGNGYGVYVALDSLSNDSETEQTIKGILAALDLLHSTPRAKIDRSVCDAKRLCPAFGTTKRKGATGIPERPHRRTGFACGVTVERIDSGMLRMARDALLGALTQEQRADADKAMGLKPAAPSRAQSAPRGADDPFARAKELDPLAVMSWLGLVDAGDVPRCPGCGETQGTAILGTGFKCSHARCSGKGHANGYRTTIDLVCEARNVEPKEAVRLLAERFGFDPPRERRQAAAALDLSPIDSSELVDPGGAFDPDPQQTVAATDDPLDALRLAGACVGYQELLAATAVRPPSIWVDGVLEDSHVEIAGPSGHGKSTLSALLLVARANPTRQPVRVLGHPVQPASPGRFVVTVQEENGLYSWRMRCEAACQALNLPTPETLERVIFLVRRNVIVEDERWHAIRALGRAGKVGAAFFDSRARVLRLGQSNSEEDQAKIAESCFKLVEDARAPIFVVSHTRKGKDGAAPDDTEDTSGSLQRAAAADVLILVTATKDAAGKVERSQAKFSKLRNAISPDHPAPVDFRMALDLDGRWVCDTSAPTPVSIDTRPLIERMKSLIEENPTGLTKYRMKELLRASHESVEKAISQLFREHLITKATDIRGSQVFLPAPQTERMWSDAR